MVLRLCASYEDLAEADCAVPDRCESRTCSICFAPVHYDPAASLPMLGAETIVCSRCMDKALLPDG